MEIPLCPHARPAWHFCPSCPQANIQQPLQIEAPFYEERPPSQEDEPAKSTVIVIEF
jgi:hypothetical protein